jgi:hypothetical protein
MTNPIQATSRSFATILNDLNADANLADKPDWIKRLVAGIGDAVSTWENASANQAFPRTAFTRRAMWDLMALIDYQMTEATPATGAVLVDIVPSPADGWPVTLSAADLVFNAPGSGSSSARRFEARAGLTYPLTTEVTGFAAWNTGTGVITVANAYTTGEKVQVSTSGVLPTGITAGTDYFAIYLSPTTIKLATSRKNAYAGTALSFSTQGSGNHTLTRLSATATAYQQQSVAAQTIGTSDGVTPYQSFKIGTPNVLRATVIVTVNGVTWSQVTTFVQSGPASQVYKLVYNTDGTVNVEFNDGVYGAIPGAFPIVASYAYGGGAASNVALPDGLNAYAGNNANVAGATNPLALTGGADPESLTHAANTGPMLLKAQNRFVTASDGQALAIAYGGLSLAIVNANAYGVLTAQVLGVASGGGSPSLALRTAIAAYLQSKTVLNSVTVFFDAGIFTPTGVTANVHLLPGYLWANVQTYIDLACKLFFSDAGSQIYEAYAATGISSAVALINSILSYSFGTNDYVVITQILSQFAVNPPRSFGDAIQLSQLYEFVQGGVPGVAYIIASVPSFPFVCAATEITQAGTNTLAQV